MKAMPVLLLLCASACVAPSAERDARAVDAVYARAAADGWHDVDPVHVRGASFARVVPVHDSGPWTDPLAETLPAMTAPRRGSSAGPDLEADLVDADPVRARGWR